MKLNDYVFVICTCHAYFGWKGRIKDVRYSSFFKENMYKVKRAYFRASELTLIPEPEREWTYESTNCS